LRGEKEMRGREETKENERENRHGSGSGVREVRLRDEPGRVEEESSFSPQPG
jgi:hypothetical protein